MIVNKNNFNEEQLNTIKELSKSTNLLLETTKILYSRGYDNKNKIEKFLNPSKNNFYNPFLLSGVDKAVERIKKARDNNEKVLIYGDYDADGICSTTILYRCLKIFGIDATTFVPERVQGYGLSIEVIDELIEKTFADLLITVDCGIGSYKEVEYLKDLGVDVIVTDHHEIPDILPDTTVINCRLNNQDYPFDTLSGAGVVYKLCYALIGEEANNFLDLVALSTIADSMPLIDENRDLVVEGLNLIREGKCLKQISILVGENVKDLTATTLAYTVAPRLNASGRMGDAYSSLKYFITDDNEEIKQLFLKLNKYNVDRQTESESLYKDAKLKLKDEIVKGIVVVCGENYRNGLVGIITAKLCEEYNLPAITFSGSGEVLHGSARSIENVNIFDALNYCKDLLVEFGGHSQAAGLSILRENIEAFKEKISNYILDNYDSETFVKKVEVEEILESSISLKLAKELNRLEPFGAGNKKPVFATKVNSLSAKRIKMNSTHITFSSKSFDYIYFNGEKYLDILQCDAEKYIVFEPNLSTFNGRESVKGFVKKVEILNNFDKSTYFFSLIRNFKNANGGSYKNYQNVSKESIVKLLNEESPLGYYKLFVLNNPNNVNNYKEITKFNQELLGFSTLNAKNTVLIGGLNDEEDYSNYKQLIYLDKPLKVEKYLNFTNVLVCEELNSFDLSNLKTDRQSLISIFLKIKELLNISNYTNYYDLFINTEFSMEDFAFAIAVFSELNLIILNQYVTINTKEKKELTNSLIYNYFNKN